MNVLKKYLKRTDPKAYFDKENYKIIHKHNNELNIFIRVAFKKTMFEKYFFESLNIKELKQGQCICCDDKPSIKCYNVDWRLCCKHLPIIYKELDNEPDKHILRNCCNINFPFPNLSNLNILKNGIPNLDYIKIQSEMIQEYYKDKDINEIEEDPIKGIDDEFKIPFLLDKFLKYFQYVSILFNQMFHVKLQQIQYGTNNGKKYVKMYESFIDKHMKEKYVFGESYNCLHSIDCDAFYNASDDDQKIIKYFLSENISDQAKQELIYQTIEKCNKDLLPKKKENINWLSFFQCYLKMIKPLDIKKKVNGYCYSDNNKPGYCLKEVRKNSEGNMGIYVSTDEPDLYISFIVKNQNNELFKKENFKNFPMPDVVQVKNQTIVYKGEDIYRKNYFPLKMFKNTIRSKTNIYECFVKKDENEEYKYLMNKFKNDLFACFWCEPYFKEKVGYFVLLNFELFQLIFKKLEYFHQNNFLHNNITDENLWISTENDFYLFDYNNLTKGKSKGKDKNEFSNGQFLNEFFHDKCIDCLKNDPNEKYKKRVDEYFKILGQIDFIRLKMYDLEKCNQKKK